MLLGVGLPVSGAWATPEAMRHVATRAEDLGFASVWAFQRLLHPVDQEWGAVYHAVADPVAALSYVAAVTERIRLGIAIVNLPFYAPIVLAKSLTTLDRLSHGRLDVGLGIGWARQEFEAAGVPMERRGARAEEFVACLKEIWTAPEVEFHGEFYDVPLSRVEPKPTQQPRPPLLMGATAEAALRRVGRVADGWVSSSRMDLTTIGTSIDVVRAAAEQAGRDPAALRFVVRGVIGLTDSEGPDDRRPLQGSAAQVRDDLEQLEQVGVTEVFLDFNWDPRSVSDGVDEAAALANADLVLEAFAPAAGT